MTGGHARSFPPNLPQDTRSIDSTPLPPCLPLFLLAFPCGHSLHSRKKRKRIAQRDPKIVLHGLASVAESNMWFPGKSNMAKKLTPARNRNPDTSMSKEEDLDLGALHISSTDTRSPSIAFNEGTPPDEWTRRATVVSITPFCLLVAPEVPKSTTSAHLRSLPSDPHLYPYLFSALHFCRSRTEVAKIPTTMLWKTWRRNRTTATRLHRRHVAVIVTPLRDYTPLLILILTSLIVRHLPAAAARTCPGARPAASVSTSPPFGCDACTGSIRLRKDKR